MHRGDQHCRNLPNRRGNLLRHRQRLPEAQGLQPQDRNGRAPGLPGQPSGGQPARRARGADRPREVLPIVHGVRVQQRAAGHPGPGDSAEQPLQCRAATEEPPGGGYRAVRFYGPPTEG